MGEDRPIPSPTARPAPVNAGHGSPPDPLAEAEKACDASLAAAHADTEKAYRELEKRLSSKEAGKCVSPALDRYDSAQASEAALRNVCAGIEAMAATERATTAATRGLQRLFQRAEEARETANEVKAAHDKAQGQRPMTRRWE